jgi:ketosteroid isomerase-like protein
MTRAWWLCVVLLLVGAGSILASDLEDLVAAEHGFAESAAMDGMRAAFLSVLAEDGILFRPGPVNGREWFEGRPPPPGVLAWKPVHAEVSRAGDLGYTTGPWRYDLEGRDSAFGHYMSIWRRTADDGWRLVLDHGIGHGEPKPSAWEPAIGKAEGAKRAKGLSRERVVQLERELAEADRGFSEAAVEKGLAEAYALAASDKIRLYRDGRIPVVGLDAVRKALEDGPPPRKAEPTAAHVADSGDFGYSYGTSLDTGEEGGGGFSYVRIWRRDDDGGWQIVLDVATPLAP